VVVWKGEVGDEGLRGGGGGVGEDEEWMAVFDLGGGRGGRAERDRLQGLVRGSAPRRRICGDGLQRDALLAHAREKNK